MKHCPVIVNIKLHFRINAKHNLRHKLQNIEEFTNIRWSGNIATLRETYGVFIIFFANGYINVTKIRSHKKISPSIRKFCMLLNIPLQSVYAVWVDNITSSGTFSRPLNLHSLKAKLRAQWPQLYVSLNAQYFPGAVCRIPKLGTIILFSTGSFIIHSRWRKSAKTIFHLTSAFISTK